MMEQDDNSVASPTYHLDWHVQLSSLLLVLVPDQVTARLTSVLQSPVFFTA